MQKKIIAVLLIFSSLLALGACSRPAEDTTETVTTVDTGENTKVNVSGESVGAEEFTEPPLTERELTMAVPEFLDEEQQMLYRRAYNVYKHICGTSPGNIDYEDTLDYKIQYSQYDFFEFENGRTYVLSQGRYQNWDDFMELVLSVFTENFFDSRNRYSTFIELDGKLAFANGARGGSMAYNTNFEDDFKLISKSDSEIVFNVIGHYSNMYPNPGETPEERDIRVKSGWEVTEEFTIRMVMTESGWRFEEFYCASLDHNISITDLMKS